MFGNALMVLGITSALVGGPPLSGQSPDDSLDENTSVGANSVNRTAGSSAASDHGVSGVSDDDSWTRLGGLVDELVADFSRRIAPRPVLTGYALYKARTRPGAMRQFWVSGLIDRLLHFLTPTSAVPLLGVAQFDVLSQVPVVAAHSSNFGYRVHPISKRRKLHRGLDFGAPRGALVRAAGPGEVTYAGRRGTYGNLVVISHGLGLETRYAHLQRIRVERNRFVTAGTAIGTVGSTGRSTGPHLHFEVRQFGEPIDPKWAMGLSEPTLADELSAMWRWFVDGWRTR